MHVAFALADSGERWASASGVLRTCVLLRSTCSQILVITGGGLCCDSSQHCRREVFGTNMHMGWDATALRTTGGLGWMGRPRRAVRKIVCVLTASCFDVSMCSPRPCRVESTRGPNRRRRGKCRWRSRLGKWGMGDGARCSYSSVHGQTEYVRVLCSFDRQEARVEQLPYYRRIAIWRRPPDRHHRFHNAVVSLPPFGVSSQVPESSGQTKGT